MKTFGQKCDCYPDDCGFQAGKVEYDDGSIANGEQIKDD